MVAEHDGRALLKVFLTLDDGDFDANERTCQRVERACDGVVGVVALADDAEQQWVHQAKNAAYAHQGDVERSIEVVSCGARVRGCRQHGERRRQRSPPGARSGRHGATKWSGRSQIATWLWGARSGFGQSQIAHEGGERAPCRGSPVALGHLVAAALKLLAGRHVVPMLDWVSGWDDVQM